MPHLSITTFNTSNDASNVKIVQFGTVTIYTVEKFEYIAIVGDVRSQDNPNYYQLGMMRHHRLSSFFDNWFWDGDPLLTCFDNWKKMMRKKWGQRNKL